MIHASGIWGKMCYYCLQFTLKCKTKQEKKETLNELMSKASGAAMQEKPRELNVGDKI